jgi:tetratricopeptide (TPR) repeat protein
MDPAGVLSMINKGKYGAAESIIDESIKLNASNSDAWFAKGLLSLSRREYENAIEFMLKSKSYGKKGDDMTRALGYSFFSMFRLDEAITYFSELKNKMPDDYFMMGIAYLLINDPISSKEYIHTAYNMEPARTKELLQLFYVAFVHPSQEVSDKAKTDLVEKINALARGHVLSRKGGKQQRGK